MIGFLGDFEISNVHGGKITIHYTTENFSNGESFVIFVNGKLVLRDEGLRSKDSISPNNITD